MPHAQLVSRVFMHYRAILGALLISLLWLPPALQASERVALVIGNAAYDHAPLRNPVNDATDLASALRAQGFTRVIAVNNADLTAMRRALRDFREALVGAELGLFFFAGHGAQYQGENYLIPVGSRIDAALDLDIEALGAQQVLRQMEGAGAQINVVILDACRDNPYPAAARSGNRGLARLETVTGGSLIAFATAPGQVADDGAGRNSPYTAALLRYLGEPLPLPELFNRVGFAVTESTRGRQVPWYQASPLPPIQLAAVSVEPSPAVVTPPSPISSEALELAFWQSIQESREVEEFQAYLHKYPKGSFAALAKVRITMIQAQAQAQAQIQSPVPTTMGAIPESPVRPASARLSVIATPANARIRIMNSALQYQDGIELAPGRYQLEVSAQGYRTFRRWLELAAGDRLLEVVLEQIPERQHEELAPAPLSETPSIPTTEHDARPATGTMHRDRLYDGTQGPEMVFIRGGTFTMGSPENESGRSSDERQRQVNVGDVWIGRYAVTFDEYDLFARATGRALPSDGGWQRHGMLSGPVIKHGRGLHPIVNLSWHDAAAYAEWLSQQTGQNYRLPTESEWEYAARAGTATARHWGDDIGRNHANCRGCNSQWGGRQTAPVGSFVSNAWGLHEMVGNVWEWTCSAYEERYDGAEQRCDDNDQRRSLRGGSWIDNPGRARVAARLRSSPGIGNDDRGFRLARSP